MPGWVNCRLENRLRSFGSVARTPGYQEGVDGKSGEETLIKPGHHQGSACVKIQIISTKNNDICRGWRIYT
jgi:hypothetical protein